MRIFPIILGIHLIIASVLSFFHLILFHCHLAVVLIVGIPILVFGVVLLVVGLTTRKPSGLDEKGNVSWE